MPNTTKGTPYVQSSDLVSAYPTTSLSLANHIDNNLAYNAVTFNNQTGTTYTFVLADASTGRVTTASNASSQTYTVPPQTSVAWATGALIRLVNIGAGAVTIAAGSGVTVSNAAGTIQQWESVNILRTGSDTWAVVRGGLPKASYSSTTGSPTVTTVSGKTCVQFTGSGSITISQAGTVEVLVVGGGGGGGQYTGGGGGGGGYLSLASAYVTAETHTIRVGAGGTGGTVRSGIIGAGGNGEASTIGALYVALGGGGGAHVAHLGLYGGSGGGGGGGTSQAAATGGSPLASQGNTGGTASLAASNYGAGGGGGSSAVGSNGTGSAGGNGGNGTASSITGSSVTRGGGGGGGSSGGTAGTGGTGGGGNATNGNTTGANASPANSGGGGGGGGYASGNGGGGGNGASGTVILLFG